MLKENNNNKFTALAPGVMFIIVLLFGAFLRFWGISYGLPEVFNADEPHIVNLAVSFGSGDLNPHIFKYPTLWPYLLFASYVSMFLFGQLAGFWHGVEEFGRFFVWHPAPFYLTGRIISATASCALLWATWKMTREAGTDKKTIWAAAFLAVSPSIVGSAHASKPDSIMLLWCALAWWMAVRLTYSGTLKDSVLCGLFLGLACSSQYTAFPLLILLPSTQAWALFTNPGKWKNTLKTIAAGFAAAGAAFALTSPFILIDYNAFLASMTDLSFHMQNIRTVQTVMIIFKNVLHNMTNFAGAWPVFAVSMIGIIYLWRDKKNLACTVIIPVLAIFIFLSCHPDGGCTRYSFPAFPALALAAHYGLESMRKVVSYKAVIPAAGFFLILPGLVNCWIADRRLNLADTRTLAGTWIKSNIPSGSVILTDQEHASPSLVMDKTQVETLFKITKASGHPRRRYYKMMLDSHPGGGFRVYRIMRSARDLGSAPGHVKWSQSSKAVIDVRPGLKSANRAGVQYVVTTTYGITLERKLAMTSEGKSEYSEFFSELYSQCSPVATFAPRGEIKGPVIEIFRLDKNENPG